MHPSRIAVIDNNQIVLSSLEYFFGAHGYDLMFHARAADAVDFIRQGQPSLTLIDLHLEYPLAGLDVVRALRADPVTMAMPLVVWSSDPDVERHVASLNLPDVAVLSKYDAAAVLRTVLAGAGPAGE